MQLKVQEVSKRFGSVHALDSLSLEIESGGVFGLVGPNGAGKSTLMRILATIEQADSGKVYLDGVDLGKKPNEMRRVLGYLPQDIAVYPNLTPVEFLEYIAAIKGIGKAVAKKQISGILDTLRLSDARKRKLGGFSGGMRQRVGIACALLGDPQVVIADEPSSGLDPEERISLRKLFLSMAKTRIVLLSTHIISDIETTASRMALVKSGKLIYVGAPSELALYADGDLENAYIQAVHGEAVI
ncbi:MAG: ABC transporter ATP-binding protein [Clostridiales bacterium]|jgi:ABC-type multidrug transport system ATPase subunit|nr:ABC transporter ATP-binding protein [Clostridiales bacterium]